MKHFIVDLDIYVTFIAVFLILIGLTGFIIYFFVLYKKKQILFVIEQEKLEVAFKQELLNTQIEVQEQTMQTIGTDLHDNIGQLLSLTSLTLKSVEIDDPDKARHKIADVLALNTQAIRELRVLGKLLQGEQLLKDGLAAAIAKEIEWIERSGRYEIEFYRNDSAALANPEQNLLVFRIVQEALNNIIKHAFANKIVINLRREPKWLRLTIQDNGEGFDIGKLKEVNGGMGLANIYKRVKLINGEVDIISSPGTGTKINISINYPE